MCISNQTDKEQLNTVGLLNSGLATWRQQHSEANNFAKFLHGFVAYNLFNGSNNDLELGLL